VLVPAKTKPLQHRRADKAENTQRWFLNAASGLAAGFKFWQFWQFWH
jgi:hypothetical protein